MYSKNYSLYLLQSKFNQLPLHRFEKIYLIEFLLLYWCWTMFILIFRPARLFNSKKGLYVLLYTKAMLYSIWCTISIDWNSMTKPYTCKSVHRDTVFFFLVYNIILYSPARGNKYTNKLPTHNLQKYCSWQSNKMFNVRSSKLNSTIIFGIHQLLSS